MSISSRPPSVAGLVHQIKTPATLVGCTWFLSTRKDLNIASQMADFLERSGGYAVAAIFFGLLMLAVRQWLAVQRTKDEMIRELHTEITRLLLESRDTDLSNFQQITGFALDRRRPSTRLKANSRPGSSEDPG